METLGPNQSGSPQSKNAARKRVATHDAWHARTNITEKLPWTLKDLQEGGTTRTFLCGNFYLKMVRWEYV
jgi:hypothetical protein